MCACVTKNARQKYGRETIIEVMLFSNGVILKIYSAHTNENGLMSEVHNYSIHICKHTCIYIASQFWVRFLQK